MMLMVVVVLFSVFFFFFCVSKRARVSISIKCVWKTKERQTERRFFKEDFREQSFFF